MSRSTGSKETCTRLECRHYEPTAKALTLCKDHQRSILTNLKKEVKSKDVFKWQNRVLLWLLACLADGASKGGADAYKLQLVGLPQGFRDTLWAFDGWGLNAVYVRATRPGRPEYGFRVDETKFILKLRAAALRARVMSGLDGYPEARVPPLRVDDTTVRSNVDATPEALRAAELLELSVDGGSDFFSHVDEMVAADAKLNRVEKVTCAQMLAAADEVRRERLSRLTDGCLAPACQSEVTDCAVHIYCPRHLALLVAADRGAASCTPDEARRRAARVSMIHPTVLVAGVADWCSAVKKGRWRGNAEDLPPSHYVTVLGGEKGGIAARSCLVAAATIAVADGRLRVGGVDAIPRGADVSADDARAIVEAVNADSPSII
ncbi:MAG: hypothetical protein HYY25_01140 [Candidatus Wallbacteria bacterium]|nr:hypothetical protein [Candidatus Wallbacteria bacterium]